MEIQMDQLQSWFRMVAYLIDRVRQAWLIIFKVVSDLVSKSTTDHLPSSFMKTFQALEYVLENTSKQTISRSGFWSLLLLLLLLLLLSLLTDLDKRRLHYLAYNLQEEVNLELKYKSK